MSTLRTLLVAILAAGAAFVAGRGSTREIQTSTVREVSAAAPRLSCPSLDPDLLRDVVRTALHEETHIAPVAEPRVEPPPEVAETRSEAETHVQRAIRRGIWSESDRETLHNLAVDSDTMGALMAQLIPAVNSQQVRVELRGPLF